MRADGTYSTLEGLRAARSSASRPRAAADHRAASRPGQTLLLFTDGLLERRGEDLDLGRDRLGPRSPRLPADLTADDLTALVERLRDPSRDDDVAVLAVTRTG